MRAMSGRCCSTFQALIQGLVRFPGGHALEVLLRVGNSVPCSNTGFLFRITCVGKTLGHASTLPPFVSLSSPHRSEQRRTAYY